MFRAGQHSLPCPPPPPPPAHLQVLAGKMPIESILNKVIYLTSQSSKHPSHPQAFAKLPQDLSAPPQPQRPHPCPLCTCSPCEFLSQQPFGHLSPPPRMPLSSISQPAIVLAAQPPRQHPHPVGQPACRLLPASPAPPPRPPSPPRPREDQAGGWESPCRLSLPPSLLLSPCLPPSSLPPPAPEVGTVQIEERGDGQSGWGPAESPGLPIDALFRLSVPES